MIWQIEVSPLPSLTLALRGVKAREEAPSLVTCCYSWTPKSQRTWKIMMDGWNLCLILACWGFLPQVQWRQMSTNAGWFCGRSVPSLKWTEARALPGWTGWCPWPLGRLWLCIFRDGPSDWLEWDRWDKFFHHLFWGRPLMYDGSFPLALGPVDQ